MAKTLTCLLCGREVQDHIKGFCRGCWMWLGKQEHARLSRKADRGSQFPEGVVDRTGPADIIGRWPGDESDEEVDDALEKLS